eukprot:snap_masked-scaffold_9-processed-gene-8.50-mRNA-1 protein AED:1.00 eAED:1.00 QI:0/0/0/0/1/1/4/0/230
MEENRLVRTNMKSSLQVFYKFTRRDVSDKLIFENIISKDCFKEWVKTRSGQLKNPKGAFRRTIYAHLRGADGRSPFVRDVEISILKKLREVSPCGKPVDPFKPVLGNRKLFKRNKAGGWLPAFEYPYGYHEKQEVCFLEQSQSLSTVKMRNGPKNVHDLSSLEIFLHMSQNQMMEFLKQGKQVSRPFNYSAVAYMLTLMASQSYFLSKDFLLPPIEQQFFRKESCQQFLA